MTWYQFVSSVHPQDGNHTNGQQPLHLPSHVNYYIRKRLGAKAYKRLQMPLFTEKQNEAAPPFNFWIINDWKISRVLMTKTHHSSCSLPPIPHSTVFRDIGALMLSWLSQHTIPLAWWSGRWCLTYCSSRKEMHTGPYKLMQMATYDVNNILAKTCWKISTGQQHSCFGGEHPQQ